MNENKVTLISGGGSGHEPAHAGLVGKGMLDAAVCGDVLLLLHKFRYTKQLKKQLVKRYVINYKNYSGDIMNFKNGAHLAKEDGIEVDYVKWTMILR